MPPKTLSDKITLTLESKLVDEIKTLKTELTEKLDDIQNLQHTLQPKCKDKVKMLLTKIVKQNDAVQDTINELLQMYNVESWDLTNIDDDDTI